MSARMYVLLPRSKKQFLFVSQFKKTVKLITLLLSPANKDSADNKTKYSKEETVEKIRK